LPPATVPSSRNTMLMLESWYCVCVDFWGACLLGPKVLRRTHHHVHKSSPHKDLLNSAQIDPPRRSQFQGSIKAQAGDQLCCWLVTPNPARLLN
jgi:hypothetical protein